MVCPSLLVENFNNLLKGLVPVYDCEGLNYSCMEKFFSIFIGVGKQHLVLLSDAIIFFQLEKGESFFTFARDMTLKSTRTMILPASIPEDLDPWRSKLLWASRVLPMPLVGLLIIGSVCADVGSSLSEFPELEALSRLDFGAAMKVFLAKRLTSE